MKLGWSVVDEKGGSPKPRRILRNSGQILGQMNELQPFILLGQYGAYPRQLRQQQSPHPGLFGVGKATGGERPGVAPRLGLILPVSFCRNAKTRDALLKIPEVIRESQDDSLRDNRERVQRYLNDAFCGDLRIPDKERLDAFFALEASSAFFARLHREFEYVTEIEDDPARVARIVETQPFGWRSHGELLEWYHEVYGLDMAWVPYTPFFVFGDTGVLASFYQERWVNNSLNVPAEDFSKWFAIRSDVANADFGIRLEMREYGWAYLHLRVGDASVIIQMSDVYDPFETFIEWSRKIEEGDVPIAMEIDEEGSEKVLSIYRTADPDRVLLIVSEKYDNRIHLDGILSRPALAGALKQEIARFFESEFAPEHWERSEQDEGEDDFIPLKQRVLAHSWFLK